MHKPGDHLLLRNGVLHLKRLHLHGNWLSPLVGRASTEPPAKVRYVITTVSMKDISNIIKEFENLPYKSYVRKRPKHETTDRYFYLARQLARCMMIDDAFNFHVEPVRTEMTSTQQILTLYVCDPEKSKSKEILVGENLLQVCSKDHSESETVIIDESSTEESESESVQKSINTNKEKDTNNKTEHK